MDEWSEETKALHRREIMEVRDILTECARNRRTITYGELRGRVPGVNFRTEGPILGAISAETRSETGVMLSAVCCGVTGIPGDGFFNLARRLGYVFSNERAFHRDELARVHEAMTARP